MLRFYGDFIIDLALFWLTRLEFFTPFFYIACRSILYIFYILTIMMNSTLERPIKVMQQTPLVNTPRLLAQYVLDTTQTIFRIALFVNLFVYLIWSSCSFTILDLKVIKQATLVNTLGSQHSMFRIPYVRHYKLRLVYFFTPFPKNIYVL